MLGRTFDSPRCVTRNDTVGCCAWLGPSRPLLWLAHAGAGGLHERGQDQLCLVVHLLKTASAPSIPAHVHACLVARRQKAGSGRHKAAMSSSAAMQLKLGSVHRRQTARAAHSCNGLSSAAAAWQLTQSQSILFFEREVRVFCKCLAFFKRRMTCQGMIGSEMQGQTQLANLRQAVLGRHLLQLAYMSIALVMQQHKCRQQELSGMYYAHDNTVLQCQVITAHQMCT